MAELYVESFGNIEEANMVGNLNALSFISVPICIYSVFANAVFLFRFWYCFDCCSPYFAIFALYSFLFFFYFFFIFFYSQRNIKFTATFVSDGETHGFPAGLTTPSS